MIKYKNFLPHEIKHGGLFSTASYECLDAVLEDVNDWVQRSQVDVINIETVLQPTGKESPDEAVLRTETRNELLGGQAGYWFQFIRVWYRE